jgi:alpha-tubulin suppressor-like RCC1 family protein
MPSLRPTDQYLVGGNMKPFRQKKVALGLSLFLTLLVLSFQNCSQFNAKSLDPSAATSQESGSPDSSLPNTRQPNNKTGIRVETGNGLTCSLIQGQVKCWGVDLNDPGNLYDGKFSLVNVPQVIIPDSAEKIAVENTTACALVKSKLQCWGKLSDISSSLPRFGSNPILTYPDDIEDFELSNSGICVLKLRELFCLGWFFYGDGSEARRSPDWTRIPFSPVLKFTVANGRICSLTDDGLFCVGDDFNGAFGTGQNRNRFLVPTKINLDDLEGFSVADIEEIQLDRGQQYLCLQSKNKIKHCAGRLPDAGNLIVPKFGKLQIVDISLVQDKCWIAKDELKCRPTGSNTYGVYGEDLTGMTREPVSLAKGDLEWASISSSNACIVQNGLIKCWGDNIYGQIGNGILPHSYSPRAIDTNYMRAENLVSTINGFCVKLDMKVNCWGVGNNKFPESDVLSFSTKRSPIQIGSDQIQLKIGKLKSLGVGGSLVSYESESGFLSFLSVPNFSPLVINSLDRISNMKDISSTLQHLCLVTLAGELFCAGSNDQGQLGDGTKLNSGEFKKIFASGVSQVITLSGSGSSCAVVNNELYCWGSMTQSETPKSLQVSGVEEIKAGSSFLVCYKKERSLFCIRTANPQASTMKAPFERVDSFALSDEHICVISLGKLFCAGNNIFGQVGDSSNKDTSIYQKSNFESLMHWNEVNLPNVTEVSVSSNSTCAISNSKVFCFGQNRNGQLGDGNSFYTSPQEVKF